MITHFKDSAKLDQIIQAIEGRVGNYSELRDKIKNEIKQFYDPFSAENGSAPRLIIGLSGGIDSSVVVFLATESVGANNVILVGMPRDHKDDALSKFRLVAEKLYVPEKNQFIIPINQIVQKEISLVNKYEEISIKDDNQDEMDRMRIGNFSSRARVAILYDIQRKLNGRVLGTGNRTEYVQGYAAKYGTPISYDFGILDELYKTDIYNLAKLVGVPEEIMKAKPTTGYFDGQTHEIELGATMQEQDALAYLLFEKKLSSEDIGKEYGVSKDFIKTMQARYVNSAHKRMLKQPHITLGFIKDDKF